MNSEVAGIMGKFFKDNDASTYAAKNVKNALDRLIEVLQSPEQVRRLVIGQTVPRKSNSKQPKIPFETPPKTLLWMETSASVAKNAHRADSEKTIIPPSSDNSSDHKRKTRSSGSQSLGSDSSYISTGRYHQMWARGLRDYPLGGTINPGRQKSVPGAELEAGWSSVPCKPGYLDVFAC